MSANGPSDHENGHQEASGLADAIADAQSSRTKKPNSGQTSGDLPRPEHIPQALHLDGTADSQDRTISSTGLPTLCDGRARRFRLTVAGAGIFGLAGLWLAMAFLRDAALHRISTPVAGAVGLASGSIHPHSRPSYTALFLLLSYSVVLAGIVFSAGVHDPHAVRLRVARKRVNKAVKEYDSAFRQRVLDPLKVEQPHNDLVDLAPGRLEVVRQKGLRRTEKGGAQDDADTTG